jgi:membrane-bound serine protease (ClpP class)
MLIILGIILLVLLPSPWNVVAFVVVLPLWVLELLAWNRTVKRRRSVVGPQTLIGREAVVATPCRPRGQVRIDGEIWEATCAAGATTGDTVRVTRVDGLTLTVEPATGRNGAGPTPSAPSGNAV